MGLEKPIVSFKCIYVKYIEALKTAQLTRAFIKKKKKKTIHAGVDSPSPFSRGSSQTRDSTQVSCIAGGFFISWATGKPQIEAQKTAQLTRTFIKHYLYSKNYASQLDRNYID